MTEEFDYIKYSENISERIFSIIPDSVCVEDKEYLVSTIKKIMLMCGEAIVKNDSNVICQEEKFSLYLQLISMFALNKGLSCVYCGIPKKHWDSLIQNVAFIVFEQIKKYIENDTSSDEIMAEASGTTENIVNEIFGQNLDKLLEENEIDEKIARLAKEFKLSTLYTSCEPTDEMTMYLKANILALEENYSDALEYFNKLIDIDHDDTRYQYSKAICLYNLQEYTQAVEIYKNLLSTVGDKSLLDSIAYCYYLAKDFSCATDYYKQYLEYVEPEADANKEKAEYYAETGDEDSSRMYDEIAADFQKAIEKTYTMIANCYYMDDDYETAMKNYDYVLELNPQNFEAIFAKAEWYRKQKCYNAAIERYFSLPDTDILDVKIIILTNIALCYDEMKQHELALGYYDKVLELIPEDAVAMFNKGACLYELQKYDEAIKLIKESLTFGFEKIVDAYRTLVYCYLYEDNYFDAMEYCNKILELEPNNAEAMLNKADCCIRKDDIGQAKIYLERALENNVESKSRTYSLLGDCYSHDKDYEKASECYNNAINEILSDNDYADNIYDSDDFKDGLAYAYYAKGNCLMEGGNYYDEAYMCFMRAIDYGYDKEECEEKINEIKRNWD